MKVLEFAILINHNSLKEKNILILKKLVIDINYINLIFSFLSIPCKALCKKRFSLTNNTSH